LATPRERAIRRILPVRAGRLRGPGRQANRMKMLALGGAMGRLWLMCAAALVALAGPASAQEDEAAPAGSAGCEFHVWPGDGLMSTYYGLVHGSTVNGQIQGRRGYPPVPPNPINTAHQAEILAAAEPHKLFRLADYRLIVHPEALPSRTIRTATGRLSDSRSPCYAELIVDDVVLQQDWVNGSLLKTLFRYRAFGAGAAPQRSFTTWAETDLGSLPVRDPGQFDAAILEIRGAFRNNVTRFAASARAQPRRR
jgi:hypothetical protein